jgi:signal transduction histidine kinase
VAAAAQAFRYDACEPTSACPAMPISVDLPDAADPFLSFEDTLAAPLREQGVAPWQVLVVDDDDDVHIATELALRDVAVEGRPLHFLHAHSAAAALALVAAHDDIAVVLLDVVMETPDAGLWLVRQIRQGLDRSGLRIILRTGQPGYAPEIETLRTFDINDYRTKSELTRVRLYSSLTAAIRAYAQLSDLTRQRDELVRLCTALDEARAAERAEAERRLQAEADLRLARSTVDACVEQRTHELQQAVKDLDTFNGMVSHDLRGPLHGLAGLSQMIQTELERADPAEIRRWLALMQQQTGHLAELVNELLTLARVSKGGLQRGPAALGAVVQEALQTLAVAGPSERLSAVTVGVMPVLACDAVLLRQVFVNLLSNALKFTRDSAAPLIMVQAERRGDEWCVTVRDNGVGFDPRRAADLFRPFSRLHEARFEGSGIGLTIVQRIVERHGGRIWAEGQPGVGASFHFTLPATA